MNRLNYEVRAKTVLVVEDDPPQREVLQAELELRGFRAVGAGDVDETRARADEFGEELDVMLLDMILVDRKHPGVTGAELGIEVRATREKWPPEFLITSAYSEVHYYRLAMDLHAAAYLEKAATPIYDVIRHVRALALRRALSIERQGFTKIIGQIAEESKNEHEAIARFCKEVLEPEFVSVLGAPFVFLLADDSDRAACVAGNAALPIKSAVYRNIVRLTEDGPADGLILDSSRILALQSIENTDLLTKLEGCVFVALPIDKRSRLLLGILKGDERSEDPASLSKVLARYLKPTVIRNLITILLERAGARNKARLAATAGLCLYVGQEEQSILSDARSGLTEDALNRLSVLASDLYSTGEALSALAGDDGVVDDADAEARPTQSTSLLEVVHEAVRDLAKPQQTEVRIEEADDLHAQVSVPDLTIAFSHVLNWMAGRLIETSPGHSPSIRVSWEKSLSSANVVFEDRSRRLSPPLRERLFAPFAQAAPPTSERAEFRRPGAFLPLFLTKALVEEKYGGLLEDRSDDLEGPVGHRLVMRLPVAQE